MGEGFRELRKGSRTSPHQDSRTKRARSRNAAKGRAINESRGSSVYRANSCVLPREGRNP